MTGMEWIDASPEKYTTEIAGEHIRCGGDLIEIKSKNIRFLVCRKCGAESFQTLADDMKEKKYR